MSKAGCKECGGAGKNPGVVEMDEEDIIWDSGTFQHEGNGNGEEEGGK
jgi:hypothetical protein